MTVKLPLPIALLLIAATSLAGCFEPIQSGGVMIVGDPSERVGALCRFRHREGGSGSFCASDATAHEEAPAAARVRRMESAAEGLKGQHASGTRGDYLLENDEIAVVISHPDSAEALLQSGGHVVDAGNAKDRVDALLWMATAFGSLRHQPAYETITSGAEGDGSAWVEVAGHEVGDDGPHRTLRIRTRYTLAAGARALAVATTLQNAGTEGPASLDLGDVVCWGSARPDAPGGGLPRRLDETTETTSAYLFGVGDGVAYAIAADGRPFFATRDTRRSDVVFRRGEAIAHPAKVTYERLLVVAPRGDTAAVASELFFLSGGTPGGVEAVVTWDAVPAARRAESRVSLRRVIEPGAATPAFPDPPSLWLTAPSDGAITAELPPGRYAAKLEGPGVISAESVAVVEAGKVTNLTLVASIFDGASQIPQKE